MATSVFVTGANGFVGEHIVKLLIEKAYKVVGSVRSTEKGEKLKKQLNSKNFEYEVVAEIGAPNAFDEALQKHKEVTVFIHSASPATIESTDVENEVMIPAVNGTKNAFSAIKAHGPQIKKVVFTSSITAMIDNEVFTNPNKVYTEESWNPIPWEVAKTNPHMGYAGSKVYAEKAAWEFLKTEKPNFTLNTVNPTLVIGPEAFDLEGRTTLKSTLDNIGKMISAGTDESKVPVICFPFIDPRDVAKAHLHAFESDVTNFRYFMFERFFTTQDVLDILNEHVPALKGKLAIGKDLGVEQRKTAAQIDNAKTRKTLGFKQIDIKDAIIDIGNQYVASVNYKS